MSATHPLLQNGPIMTDDEVARFFGSSKFLVEGFPLAA